MTPHDASSGFIPIHSTSHACLFMYKLNVIVSLCVEIRIYAVVTESVGFHGKSVEFNITSYKNSVAC